MNRKLAAVVGLLALALLVQASEGGTPEGTLASASSEASVEASPAASNPATVLTLVNTIDTSSWSPPSPDPTGVTYRTNVGRILVSDSEVDEIVSLFTGKNLFESTAAGVLFDTGSLTARTLEPTDIAWDSNSGVLYVADDDLDRIFRINPQADGKFGTADDTSETTYTTSSFGSHDAEGLAYNPADRSLWVVDGALVRVYHLERGADGQFSTADDIITSWDARPLGMRQPEGITFDATSGHLFLLDRANDLVAEASAAGTLLALFDLSGSPIVSGSSITLAPASGGTGTNIYVADRGVDNDVDPNENDGKIFEFSRTTVSTNVAPIVASPGRQFNVEGEAVHLLVVAFEPNGDPMVFSALNLPDGLSIDAGTGVISGTVSFAAATGTAHTVEVTATDGSLSDTATWRWEVTAGNRPPAVQTLPDQVSVEGDVVGLQVIATDPDSDPLTYSASNLPTGLGIDPGTGLISGTVAAGASAGSPYNAEVTATDPENLFDTKVVRWTVTAVAPNQPPEVQNPGDRTDTEGDVVSLHVMATDPESDPLTYSANNLPAGLGIDPGTGLISGTLELGAAAGSPYSVQVSASDGGSTDTESFLWSVSAGNGPPEVQNPGNRSNAEGDVVSLQIVATDPENDPLTYSASNLPAGLGIDPGTGLISGTVAFGAAAGSPYSVQVGASDAGSTDTESFLWTVNPGVVLQFSATTYSVVEGGVNATITVVRSGPTAAAVGVSYSVSNGSAVAGSDYTTVSGTLSFGAGQTSKTFTVPILADTLDEADETVNLALSQPTGGATLGAPSTAVLTIADNDTGGVLRFSAAAYGVSEGTASVTVTVTRTDGAASGVTVAYATSDGSAVAGSDYTAVSGILSFGAGQTSLKFTVPVLPDTLDEANETVNLALSQPTGGATLVSPSTAVLTIEDNDTGGVLRFSAATYTVGEGSASVIVTVTRSNGAASGVTVDYAASDGSGTAGSDYSATSGSLSFGAAETSKSFTVPILDDGLGEGNETVNLALSQPTGGATLGSPSTAVLTVVDDEMALQFSAATYSVVEGGVNVTITVVRSGPTAATVGVSYSASDGSAVAGSDYRTVSGTLSFGSGQISKTFTVPILADAVDEPNETVNLALSGPTGGALLGPRSTAVLTIVDND
jgi:Calx-beta domain-containing protein/putative Ig domain-containing protein/SdiA-regulated protein